MKSDYTIVNYADEGTSAQLYYLAESKTKAFKEYRNKKTANFAYCTQKKLASLGLAPKVFGKVCKLRIKNWDEPSNWGYITQIVKCNNKRLSKKKIQQLVNDIYQKTGLKFWDCHDFNIGIFRNKYLCIDTGEESFDSDCNAWGMIDPGPQCSECYKFRCNCESWSY